MKIKFHDFRQITRSFTQSQELTTLDRVLPLAKELLKSVEYEQHPIRLIGLSVSNPKEEAGHAARTEGDNAIYKVLDNIAWFRDYHFEKESPLLGPVKMSVTVINVGRRNTMRFPTNGHLLNISL